MKGILALLLLVACVVKAEVSMPSILASNMVLQQNTEVNLWGWATPTEHITVIASWDQQSVNTVGAPDGTWKVSLKTPSAGGAHVIRIQGSNLISLNNILIGEVWLCSGQSNMAMTAAGGAKDAFDELPTALNRNVRLYKMNRRSAPFPQTEVGGAWAVCDSASVRNFSAVGYFFGKKLHSTLGIPVGLIDMSWGGTKIEAWTPADVVNLYPETRHSAETMIKTQWAPAIPGVLYNAMVAPIINFNIAGVIWYQGESNRHYAPAYYTLTHLLVNSWRKSWRKEFPFYSVQLAPYQYGGKFETALLREHQIRAMDIPNSGVVVTTDLADKLNDIHPAYKRQVGDRLASWALAETYHRAVGAYKSPQYRSMQISGGVVRLLFDHVPNGLVSSSQVITEFEVAGPEKRFVHAHARITDNMVEVWAEDIKEPVAVRFAFRDAPAPNLFSREGLPVVPFRTDKWDLGLTFSE